MWLCSECGIETEVPVFVSEHAGAEARHCSFNCKEKMMKRMKNGEITGAIEFPPHHNVTEECLTNMAIQLKATTLKLPELPVDAERFEIHTCPAIPEKKFDEVNHPKHYNNHKSGIECISLTEHMSFCSGSAGKYLWRSDEKHATPVVDLKKCVWYCDRELALNNYSGPTPNLNEITFDSLISIAAKELSLLTIAKTPPQSRILRLARIIRVAEYSSSQTDLAMICVFIGDYFSDYKYLKAAAAIVSGVIAEEAIGDAKNQSL